MDRARWRSPRGRHRLRQPSTGLIAVSAVLLAASARPRPGSTRRVPARPARAGRYAGAGGNTAPTARRSRWSRSRPWRRGSCTALPPVGSTGQHPVDRAGRVPAGGRADQHGAAQLPHPAGAAGRDRQGRVRPRPRRPGRRDRPDADADPGPGAERRPVRRDPRHRRRHARRGRGVGPRGRADAVHPRHVGAVGSRTATSTAGRPAQRVRREPGRGAVPVRGEPRPRHAGRAGRGGAQLQPLDQLPVAGALVDGRVPQRHHRGGRHRRLRVGPADAGRSPPAVRTADAAGSRTSTPPVTRADDSARRRRRPPPPTTPPTTTPPTDCRTEPPTDAAGDPPTNRRPSRRSPAAGAAAERPTEPLWRAERVCGLVGGLLGAAASGCTAGRPEPDPAGPATPERPPDDGESSGSRWAGGRSRTARSLRVAVGGGRRSGRRRGGVAAKPVSVSVIVVAVASSPSVVAMMVTVVAFLDAVGRWCRVDA